MLFIPPFFPSCQTLDSSMRHEGMKSREVSTALPTEMPTAPDEYLLRHGDRLSVVFMPNVKKDLTDEYRLDVGDEVRVSFYDREDLSGVFLVIPDGWLHLPLIKELKVKGMVLPDLQKTIINEYKTVINNPQVTVGLNRYNNRLSAFISALTHDQGSVYETTVEADGMTVLPLLGFVSLKDMNLKEVNNYLSEQYHKILPSIDVTVRFVSTRRNTVTVLGEVKSPGSFEVTGTISLIGALGIAGGWTPGAHLPSLIVVQQRKGKLYVSKYDLERNLVTATQVQLAAGDMVFMPRSNIADINIFIDQYLRRNIPVSVGIGIPVGGN